MWCLQAIHSKVMALSAERGGRRADYTVQSQNSLANGVFLQVNGALKTEVCCCTEPRTAAAKPHQHPCAWLFSRCSHDELLCISGPRPAVIY